MKVLFIGGTGNISAACSRRAIDMGIDLFHLNRGSSGVSIPGVQSIIADVKDPEQVKNALSGHDFDVVANFIAYTPGDVAQDIGMFSGMTKQYIFISTASAYQKPVSHPIITESTPLCNPYWDYSRNKIACEDLLMRAYREQGFPVTIVRPSHTYETVIPAAIGSWTDYTLIDRIRRGKKIIIHGDGHSLWVMTHARDFAKGFNGLLGHQQAIGHAFHITSDEVLTWNQIYEAMAEAVGVELPAVHVTSDFVCQVADSLGMDWMRGNLFGDKNNSVIFDNTKIKRFVPDYCATIPFRQGIRKTIEWFEAEKSRMVIDEMNNLLIDTVLERYPGH